MTFESREGYFQRRVFGWREERVSSHPLRTAKYILKNLKYRKIIIIFVISMVDLVGIDVHIVQFHQNVFWTLFMVKRTFL